MRKRVTVSLFILSFCLIPNGSLKAMTKTYEYKTTKGNYKDGLDHSKFPLKMNENGQIWTREKITYQVLGRETQNSSAEMITRTKSGLNRPSYKPAKSFTQNGVHWKLIDFNIKTVDKREKKSVSKKITSDKNQFPLKKKMDINHHSVIVKRGTVKKKEEWKTGPAFTIVVKNYDKGVLVLNGKRIHYTNQSPNLSSAEKEVLSLKGLSKKDAAVTQTGWSGNKYKKDGVWYRTILVKTKVQKRTFTATYIGTYTVRKKTYQAVMKYNADSSQRTTYTVRATAHYTNKPLIPKQTSVPRQTKKTKPRPANSKTVSSTVEPTAVPAETIEPSPVTVSELSGVTPEAITVAEVSDSESEIITTGEEDTGIAKYIPTILVLAIILIGGGYAAMRF